VVRRILRRTGPGAILMLHDGGQPPGQLVRTVEMLVDKLRAAGYEVVRLDRMLASGE
jgi:hypothetical protein